MSNHIGIGILGILAIAAVASGPQRVTEIPPAAEEHIQQLMNGLSPESDLRRALMSGAHGDGVAKSWMAEMRHQGLKRVLVWVAIDFDRRGKPKRMRIHRMDYSTTYEDAVNVLDSKRLTSIRTSGLEQKIASIAIENAAHGFWSDVPRPKPHPFVGGATIEFFDDEWIPTLRPLYCAGASCLPEP